MQQQQQNHQHNHQETSPTNTGKDLHELHAINVKENLSPGLEPEKKKLKQHAPPQPVNQPHQTHADYLFVPDSMAAYTHHTQSQDSNQNYSTSTKRTLVVDNAELPSVDDEEVEVDVDDALLGGGSCGNYDDHHQLQTQKKAQKRFSPEEDKLIELGMEKFGADWTKIINWAQLSRNPKQVKSRYERRLSLPTNPKRNSSSSSSLLIINADHHHHHLPPVKKADPLADITELHADTKPNDNGNDINGIQPCLDMRQDSASNSVLSEHSTPRQKFQPHETPKNSAKKLLPHSPNVRRIEDYFRPIATPAKLENEIKELHAKIADYESEIKKQNIEIDDLLKENHQITTFYEDKFAEINDRYDKQAKTIKRILIDLLRETSQKSFRQDQLEASEKSLRLGHIKHLGHGHGFREVVVNGWEFDDLKKKHDELIGKREDLEKLKKALQKQKYQGKTNLSVDNAETPANSGFVQPANIVDLFEEEEALRMRMNILKRDESDLLSQTERLEIERDQHLRNLKLLKDEEQSRLSGNPVLANRYLLQRLIGKGGFSEVYKAFDLIELRQVACKIQSLSSHWSSEKKANYIRHSVREFKIHRALNNPRVVKCYDIFEIDNNSFGIVLEYCKGGDLDQYLRNTPNKYLPEKEARSIMIQIFAGLKYLNKIHPPIIHYDLKSANILMTDEGVKITDFGLSKIVDIGPESEGVELTSQGAGTYWYLPPECFMNSGKDGQDPIRISSKVDVWSAGVVFYQMLYGVKPFGQDQSQQTILAENTIVNAHYVNFPPKPAVSNEAKDFIRRCLEYRKELRPDVLTISESPYLKPPRKSSSAGSHQ